MERSHKTRHTRHIRPHHPELSPVGTTVTYRKPHLPKHYTTCGTYYGGSFLDPIGPSTAQYDCTCSRHKPHVCCKSLTEYMSPSTHQRATHVPNANCRTKLFIRKDAGESGKDRVRNVGVLEPIPSAEASAESSQASQEMKMDTAADDGRAIKPEPGNDDGFEIAGVPVVKQGADVDMADDNTGDNVNDSVDDNGDDNVDVDQDDIPDMEPIPLGDPVDAIIDSEYNVVSEFPEDDGDSDDNFDVPSPTDDVVEEPAQAPSVWSTITSYASNFGGYSRYF